MSKELLPELPIHSGLYRGEMAWDEWSVRTYGQVCYEAGRKAVGSQQSHVAKRKVIYLHQQGYVVNGVAMFSPEKNRRVLVGDLGEVHWVKVADPSVLNDALRFVQWFTSGNGTPRDPVMVVRRASDITAEATPLRERLLAIIDGEKA